MINNDEKKFLFFLIGVHFVWGLYFMLVRGAILLNDSQEYLWQAQNIFEGFLAYCGDLSLPINDFYFSKRPPFYPIFLAFFGLGGTSVFTIIITQNICSISLLLLLRRILVERKTYYKWGFAILLLSSFSYFIYVNSIMSEIILMFLLTIMAFNFHRFLRAPQKKYVLWFNIALSLAIFTKPVFYPFVIVNLIFWFIYNRKMVVYSLLPLVLVMAYFARNKSVTGVLHFSSIQHINWIDYNLKYYNTAQKGLHYADSLNSSIHIKLDTKNNFVDKSDYLGKQVKGNLKGQYLSYTFFHCKGALRGMVDPGNFDIKALLNKGDEVGFLKKVNAGGALAEVQRLMREAPFHFIILLVNFANKVLLLLGLLVFIFYAKEVTYWKLFLVGVLFYVVFLTGPINASRFMLGVWPIQLLSSVSAWHFIKSKF